MNFAEKKKLVEILLATLERDLDSLTKAAFEAREAATHGESKAENKYDTRGLEASYLAGGQAKRAAELREMVHFYKTLTLGEIAAGGRITAPALVRLECEGKESEILLVPKGSQPALESGGKSYSLVTSKSPLGQELLGRESGEDFDLLLGGKKRTYTILAAI